MKKDKENDNVKREREGEREGERERERERTRRAHTHTHTHTHTRARAQKSGYRWKTQVELPPPSLLPSTITSTLPSISLLAASLQGASRAKKRSNKEKA